MTASSSKHAKKLPHIYMREHSIHIRTMSRHSHQNLDEDPTTAHDTVARALIVTTCRARQRKLQHAWSRWTKHTGVVHDYLKDVMSILSRPLPASELRTELEVEVFFKWVLQDFARDPTGIAYTLYMCKSKRAIVNLIQHARMERYQPGEAILLQNSPPLPEEGLFTLLRGTVDIIILSKETDQVSRLHRANKCNDTNGVRAILTEEGILADTLHAGAGFGELSALTKVRRAASIMATEGSTCYSKDTVDILVVTTQDLVNCLEKRRKYNSKAPQIVSAEVMDFLRQTGLVHKATIVDVMQAAANITKKTYTAGTILYKQGDKVDKVFIILSGEIILDVGKFSDSMDYQGHLFQNVNPSNCYVLASGSILGDEGMIGRDRTYDASAVVLSEESVVFEMEGFAINFLEGRLGLEKYSALLYKDQSIDAEACDDVLGEIVIHSIFNSLRKVISAQNPFRRIGRPEYTCSQQKLEQKKIKVGQIARDSWTNDTSIPIATSPEKESESAADGVPASSSKALVSRKSNQVSRKVEEGRRAERGRGVRRKAAALHFEGDGEGEGEGEGGGGEPHTILSSGGLHHLHFVRRGLKRREAIAMRDVAERTVLHKNKIKMEANRPSSSSAMNSSQQTREKMALDYANAQHVKNSERYRRAREDYIKRKDREFSEHLKRLEQDELSLIQSLQSSTGNEDLFVQATNHAIDDLDTQSASSVERSTIGRSRTLDTSEAEMTKLEKYYVALAQTPPPVVVVSPPCVPHSQRSLTRMPSRGTSPPPSGNTSPSSRRPLTASLTAQNLKSRSSLSPPTRVAAILETPSSVPLPTAAAATALLAVPPREQSSEVFYRVATSHTVGVERAEEPGAKYNYTRKHAPFSRGNSNMSSCNLPLPHAFSNPNMNIADASKITTKNCKTEDDYNKKLRKFLDVAQDHTRSREEMSRGVYGNDPVKSTKSPLRATKNAQTGNRKFLEVHKLQQSLKSTSNISRGSVLLKKASMQLEGEDEAKKPSISDFVLNKEDGCLIIDKGHEKLGIKPWDLTSNDITELKIKADERVKVLQNWQEMVDREPARSSHQLGRSKSVATSVHRNNTERDRIKSETEIANLNIPGVTQDMKDLLRWKQYCAKEVLTTKHGPLHSMPTLAKQGAKAYLGRKMIVNMVERKRPHTAA